jgi:uncharacterized repeat protein (TIGR01451 family)
MDIRGPRPTHRRTQRPWTGVFLTIVASVVMLLGLLSLMAVSTSAVDGGTLPSASFATKPLSPAAPIPPPEGYPKLNLSTKTVTPTLTNTGGDILTYTVEIRNTGATTATNTTLVDTLPTGASYTGGVWTSHGLPPVINGDTLSWTGEVGFDTVVVITFNVQLDPAFSGTLRNTAVISDPLFAHPVTVTAETVVTDEPILALDKTSSSAKPGANKPLFYTLQVTNWGQPATNEPITITDQIPLNTILRSVGPDGVSNGDVVTWTRHVTLELGQSSTFTFSVDVGDVPSGTVIANEHYAVTAPFGVTAGEPYTVTIVDPIFLLSKRVWPDPPGSNREMTYTLKLLNVGSMATDLLVTDRVPAGVSYVHGGSLVLDVVSWSLPELDTGKSAQFSFTVSISDVMNVPIVNDDYGVCSAEGVCAPGEVLTSVVQGPIFETFATVFPIAKKPGGEPVTPTLRVQNVGHGNAIAATVVLTFYRMSLTDDDIWGYLPDGSSVTLKRGPDCSDKCRTFPWSGDIAHGESVTFTVPNGISTIGGTEGDRYIATIIVTDSLANMTTPTATARAEGKITHFASVVPLKSAPAVIGREQLLTYTIHANNRAFVTDLPPILTDTLPFSTTFVRASDGGVTQTISDTTFVSWTLPLLGPGDEVVRTFTVRTDKNLVSGTKIVNRDYAAFGYGNIVTDAVTSGPPVTTTVQEIGLVDSFKTVTPQLALPGAGNVLTYEIHLVNSSGLTLTDVTAYDLLPWAASTYRRDAVASAGELVSDIISVDWQGNVGPYSEVVFTASVLVDTDFEGALTNTVVISHPDLLSSIERHAVAYVTTQPVLLIRKSATPDPVSLDKRLTYRLWVTNLGQQATALVITDVVPNNVTYVPDSASSGGLPDGEAIRWNWPVLEPGEQIQVSFQVTVEQGTRVVNARYGVRSSEGVSALGSELVTLVQGGGKIYLPLVVKQAS